MFYRRYCIASERQPYFLEVKRSIMGLGYSSYVFFNRFKLFDKLIEKLDESLQLNWVMIKLTGGYDTAYQEWVFELLTELKTLLQLMPTTVHSLPSAFSIAIV
eukprot:Gregarina_sp_Poly_1__4171@NODE_2283_length_2363_cov_53_851916_g1462_i0_p1_GENE_NODE_2283_length_2363_cov_53_851916_g1462_i0NODE_2283_length_2363_cov_53_851916_g1462_i0_p1_ORF_typecomplete_len103_score15_83_NODE_2283_length_2363_cov_53_851916_g1462_i0553861